MVSLESIRAKSEQFCVERQWEPFHTPTNLCLALVGEVGEVNECFQWKGGDCTMTNLELTHIGEELSDVFIYSTRLCQQCNIDLSLCVAQFINGSGSLLLWID